MAIRARSDNLSLDVPAAPENAPAQVHDFTEVWAQREALRQACLRMIGDPARAEDLVQDTFMSALKCSGRLNEGQPVAPWLKTVARRRSIDELRGRDRVALMADPPEPWGLSVEDPADYVVSQELVEQLRAAIAELSVRERQLLLRQASYGLSLAELAAEEQTSIASVRSVLARARQKLRTSLERGGVFGVLPLPRFLVTLRERLFRWGTQLEPTLPAMTGAGARFGEAVAAVITAIALFLAGSGVPNFPDSSLISTGFASSEHDALRPGGSSAGAGGSGPNGSSTKGSPPPRIRPTSAAVPSAPLPPEIGDTQIPNDGHVVDSLRIESMVASGDGEVILVSGWLSEFDSAIFRSTDGGRSWTRHSDDSVEALQKSRTFRGGQLHLAPDFPADPRVYAVNAAGIYRSYDTGLSFTLITPGSRPSAMSPNFGSGDERLFVSGPVPSEYRESDDKLWPFALAPGMSLTEQAGIAPSPDFDTSGLVLVGGTTQSGDAAVATILGCDISGCSPRAQLPNFKRPTHLLTAQSVANTVFAWNLSNYVARSTDGGTTFTQQSLPAGFAPAAIRDTGGALYRLGYNPARQAAPIYRSDDGGASWSPLGVGTPMAGGALDILALPNGHLLAAYVYGGVFCSADGGLTWAERCPSS